MLKRPSFIKAARPEKAIPLYETFLKRLSFISGRPVQCGEFGAMMEVALVNDGPVTIIMDTKDKIWEIENLKNWESEINIEYYQKFKVQRHLFRNHN